MPLTAGKRNEENERFLNTLQRLISLTFVPENFGRMDVELDALGLSVDRLQHIAQADLLEHLATLQIDFENRERFADFLAKGFPMLAKGVYDDIQMRSGVFSVAIFNKIQLL